MTDDAPTTATESQDERAHRTDKDPYLWLNEGGFTATDEGSHVRLERDPNGHSGDPAVYLSDLLADVADLSDEDRRRMAYHLRVQAERMRDDSQQAVAKSLERGADALDPEGGE